MDLVSVVIPVFNGSEYLRQAIDSVLGQTYEAVEIIVVDDGSTDDSSAIARSYSEHVACYSQPNRGVAAALNRGIQEAKGHYIAWLSHDDVFLPEKLQQQIGFLGQHPELRACYTDFYIINADGEIIREVEAPWYPRQRAIWVLFGNMYINGSSMLIERACFDEVGLFDEALKYSQDMDMWMRMLLAFDIGRVPEMLLKWRSHPGQGSRDVKHHTSEKWEAYRRVFEALLAKGLYPKQVELNSDAPIQAGAYLWLGDTMVARRQWYAFAVEQYAKALALWPSLRNPAGSKLLVTWMRDIYWKTRRALGTLRRSILRAG